MANIPRETAPFHRIRWISIVGGFMDGTKIEFAPGLNCIIGARGTGKTTVLEFIRFALDAMPDDREDALQVARAAFAAAWDRCAPDAHERARLAYASQAVRSRLHNLRRDAARLRRAHVTLSLDAPLTADGLTLADLVPAPATRHIPADEAAILRAQVAALPPHQRDLLIAHYYDGQSLQRIGDTQGVSRSAVCQRLRTILRTLRSTLAPIFGG